MASSQVNLHNHSQGSFLDGLSRVEDIVKRSVALGHEYAALTDHGEVNQHIALSRACADADIGAVYGMEGYWLTSERLAQARADKCHPHPSHICFLAANDTGLKNLWALSTQAYCGDEFYHKPIVTPDTMRRYADGIWASDGCMLTDFSNAVDAGDDDLARQILGVLIDIFGDRFYMELHTWQFMAPQTDEERGLNARMKRLNEAKLTLARELSVPFVVVNDSHHCAPEQWKSREVLWSLNTGDSDRLGLALENASQKADHIMDEAELVTWMGKHGISEDVVIQGVKTSYEIASSCTARISPTLRMPRLYSTDTDDIKALVRACEEGFRRRVTGAGLDESIYLAQMETELKLIVDRNFCGYFNVVAACVNDLRSGAWGHYVGTGTPRPLLVGPGRGSVGGCLVAYLMGIHQVDPIKHGTLFSRFLSPGRKSLPDIDVDVPRSERPEILEYLSRRFGEDNVCAIGTVNRSGVRQTVKDIGRAQGISFKELQDISDVVGDLHSDARSWADVAEDKKEELAPYVARYPSLFSHLASLVGVSRHCGVHASGVVISGDPIPGRVPLRRSAKVVATQFEMDEVELLGGVKFDWLGLRHLDTLTVVRGLVYERHNVWIDYDGTGVGVPPGADVVVLNDERLTEPQVWQQIDDGCTAGIFQLETPLSTSAGTQYRPRGPHDVANLTSIVRPGVSDAGLRDVFLKRRSGEMPIVYDHPLMERFVGPGWVTDTYGVLVYQEQLILCVQELAGFTADEADDLRKAVGKKLPEKLAAMCDKFLQGCLKNPEFVEHARTEAAAKAVAEKVWRSMEAAGRYAFNWSHAVEYGGFLSSWEVWVKYHYPAEFLVACLRTDPESVESYIREARLRGLTILGPDVNRSGENFSLDGDSIRFGLANVKGLGVAAAADVCANAPYNVFDDYLRRAGKGTHKAIVYNLVVVGAFDAVVDRDSALAQLDKARAVAGLSKKTLFNETKLNKILNSRMTKPTYCTDKPDFGDPWECYRLEIELLGTHVGPNPMEQYRDVIAKNAIKNVQEEGDLSPGTEYQVGGEIRSICKTVTKRGRNPGQDMARFSVYSYETEFRVVAFPEAWKKSKSLIREGVPVLCLLKKLDTGGSLMRVKRLDMTEVR